MFSIFEVMCCVIHFILDNNVKLLLENRFRNILILLLRKNKDNDFDVFFEAMKYIRQKIAVSNFYNIKLYRRLLYTLKSFNFYAAHINNFNSPNTLKFVDSIYISTPFELALLCTKRYNDLRFYYPDTICEHVQSLLDIPQFFIENDAAHHDTKCALHFYQHFKLLKHLPQRRKNNNNNSPLSLKCFAAKAIKKNNVDYNVLQCFTDLYNFVTVH